MRKVFRIFQLLSYLATIVIAVLLFVLIIKDGSNKADYRLPETNGKGNSTAGMESTKPNKSVVGSPVPLYGINWKENRNTLILYLSSSCRFCTESTPFYQRIIAEKSDSVWTPIAVMPQEGEQARSYLESNGLSIKDTYRASFASIGVTATPTLLLVDESGQVIESWRGKLSPDREEGVLAKLRALK